MPYSMDCIAAIAFPWSNTKALADALKNGELCISTAISQFNAVVRETLKVFEEFARDQMKSNVESKSKVERMDKLITDLSEKCQAMQQALLYKEEKYDEKCREAERYKVICELSSKAAVSDDIYYTQREENNDYSISSQNIINEEGCNQQLQRQQPGNSPNSSIRSKNVKTHTKLNLAQIQMSDHMEPLQSINRPDDNDEFLRSEMGSQYFGGSCKRKAPSTTTESSEPKRNKFQDRLAIMGGMNVQGPKVNSGPVPLTQIHRHDEFLPNNQNSRVKIALMGQSSKVMSSSENAVNQFKQNFTEKNLHKQVAGESWTRMSSRKKKGWPF